MTRPAPTSTTVPGVTTTSAGGTETTTGPATRSRRRRGRPGRSRPARLQHRGLLGAARSGLHHLRRRQPHGQRPRHLLGGERRPVTAWASTSSSPGQSPVTISPGAHSPRLRQEPRTAGTGGPRTAACAPSTWSSPTARPSRSPSPTPRPPQTLVSRRSAHRHLGAVRHNRLSTKRPRGRTRPRTRRCPSCTSGAPSKAMRGPKGPRSPYAGWLLAVIVLLIVALAVFAFWCSGPGTGSPVRQTLPSSATVTLPPTSGIHHLHHLGPYHHGAHHYHPSPSCRAPGLRRSRGHGPHPGARPRHRPQTVRHGRPRTSALDYATDLPAEPGLPSADRRGHAARRPALAQRHAPSSWAQSDSLVVVGAHIDTKAGAPGGNDNASGVGVVLELARDLHDADTAATIEFVTLRRRGDDRLQRLTITTTVRDSSCRVSRAEQTLRAGGHDLGGHGGIRQ